MLKYNSEKGQIQIKCEQAKIINIFVIARIKYRFYCLKMKQLEIYLYIAVHNFIDKSWYYFYYSIPVIQVCCLGCLRIFLKKFGGLE